MEPRHLDQSRLFEVKQSLLNFDAASPMTDGQLRKHESEHTRQPFQGNKRRRFDAHRYQFLLGLSSAVNLYCPLYLLGNR